jgi:hypothetical protein
MNAIATTPITMISDNVTIGANPSLFTPISDVKILFALAPFLIYLLLLSGLCNL